MTSRIELTQTSEVTDIMVDVDFACSDSVDFIDALQIVLDKAKSQKDLQAGKYNVRLLAVVTKEEETVAVSKTKNRYVEGVVRRYNPMLGLATVERFDNCEAVDVYITNIYGGSASRFPVVGDKLAMSINADDQVTAARYVE